MANIPTKRLFLFLILGIGVSAIAWISQTSIRTNSAIRLEPEELQLVTRTPGKRLEGTLHAVNLSNNRLGFEIRASCGCTDVFPRSGVIDPNKTMEIHVVMDVPNRTGAETQTYISLKTDGQECLSKVVARSESLIVADPAFVDFGEIERADSESEAQVHLTRADGRPLLPQDVTLRQHDGIFTSVIEPESNGCTLRIKRGPDAIEGEAKSTLEILIAGVPNSTTIPIRMRVVPAMWSVPKSIRIIGNDVDQRSIIICCKSGSSLGKLINVAVPQGLQVEPIAPSRQNRACILLRRESPGAPVQSGKIELTFEEHAVPLIVPVECESSGPADVRPAS